MIIRINRTLVTMLLLVGFLFITTVPVNASNDVDSVPHRQVIFSKEPIADESVLYDRALKGETDLISDQSFIKNIVFDKVSSSSSCWRSSRYNYKKNSNRFKLEFFLSAEDKLYQFPELIKLGIYY